MIGYKVRTKEGKELYFLNYVDALRSALDNNTHCVKIDTDELERDVAAIKYLAATWRK